MAIVGSFARLGQDLVRIARLIGAGCIGVMPLSVAADSASYPSRPRPMQFRFADPKRRLRGSGSARAAHDKAAPRQKVARGHVLRLDAFEARNDSETKMRIERNQIETGIVEKGAIERI
ncbi:MAG: hypothetical protein KF723_20725 [Rhizobiaceae bacterium]|nr:hypothetical protein [Rhizobiaceae bacterium]